MKKSLDIIIILVLICSYNSANSQLSIPSNIIKGALSSAFEMALDEVKQQDADIQIWGEFICSNDYFDTGEYFKNFPESIPAITFYQNGRCDLTVNYFEGVSNVSGTYRVEYDRILVDVDLKDTVFKEEDIRYMENQYIFKIINQEQLIIERGFYAVSDTDYFLKQD